MTSLSCVTWGQSFWLQTCFQRVWHFRLKETADFDAGEVVEGHEIFDHAGISAKVGIPS